MFTITKGGGERTDNEGEKSIARSIPLPLRFVSPPISFLRPFALTLYTRVHARTTITRRDNDDPDRADNRLFARPRFLCILLRGERERKLRSSRVLITPGVASGQHFIFALPATFLIPVATGRPKNILIAPSPLNTFYAQFFLLSSPPTVEFLLRSSVRIEFVLSNRVPFPNGGKRRLPRQRHACPCIWNCQRAYVPTGVPFTAVSLNESSPHRAGREKWL